MTPKKILELKRIVKFREPDLKPSPCQRKFRRYFPSQLARRRCETTLELRSFAYEEALRFTCTLRLARSTGRRRQTVNLSYRRELVELPCLIFEKHARAEILHSVRA